MAKVAFLGLGMMGAPMAGRLLGAGHEVTVWNRTAGKAEPLVAQGAAAASSPKRAAGRAGRELKVAEAARRWLEQADQAGDGQLDFSAVIATITGRR